MCGRSIVNIIEQWSGPVITQVFERAVQINGIIERKSAVPATHTRNQLRRKITRVHGTLVSLTKLGVSSTIALKVAASAKPLLTHKHS